MIYYILPKNYRLHDKESFNLNMKKKINLKPDEEYIIEHSIVNIDLEIPLQIENFLKTETIINQPDMIIETSSNSIIKIKNTKKNDIEFTYQYKKIGIV